MRDREIRHDAGVFGCKWCRHHGAGQRERVAHLILLVLQDHQTYLMLYHNSQGRFMTEHAKGAGFCCADHSGVANAQGILAQAEARARARGLRLTPVRHRTLEILLQAHGALGAYDVLGQLAAEGYGTQPPVAYRALNFLVENGLAHRIRRLNAFTACAHPAQDHRAAFLICTRCDSVTEAPAQAISDALARAALDAGFQLDRATIEAVGLCHACTDVPA